jgi:hypothetical protein
MWVLRYEDHHPSQGFFFSILRCSEIGAHAQEDLAKFVYVSNMKVKKKI